MNQTWFRRSKQFPKLFVLLLLLLCFEGCLFKSCSPTNSAVEKPSSIHEWVLLKNKKDIVYNVKDVFINTHDSSEVIWKQSKVRFSHLKDSLAGGITFLQYQVEALSESGSSLGERDTFWLWWSSEQNQELYVMGQGLPSMPRFIALKKAELKAESEERAKLEKASSVDTLSFPFFFAVDTNWNNHAGDFQEENTSGNEDEVYSWNGKQYKVWNIQRTLSHQGRNISNVQLLYGSVGLMYSEQTWRAVGQRSASGELVASGEVKRIYELKNITK